MAQKAKDNYRQLIGSWGEDQAAAYLVKNGCTILQRNYRCPEGEIDIIADDSGTVIFVEVKTRTNLEFGFPEEAVTDEKLEHIYAATEYYLAEHVDITDWRIDVLALRGKPGANDLEFVWFKDAG